MSDVTATMSGPTPGDRVRAHREGAGISLDDLADKIHRAGCDRPSIAKLSRIENGLQPVPIDILDGLARVTGIPPRMLRPDLAKLFSGPRPRGRRRSRVAA